MIRRFTEYLPSLVRLCQGLRPGVTIMNPLRVITSSYTLYWFSADGLANSINIPQAYMDGGVRGVTVRGHSHGARYPFQGCCRKSTHGIQAHGKNPRCKISSGCYQQVAMACIQPGKNNRYRTAGEKFPHIPQRTPNRNTKIKCPWHYHGKCSWNNYTVSLVSQATT